VSIFIETPEAKGVNIVTDVHSITSRHPEYQQHFDLIKDERPFQDLQWDGKGSDWRKVADLTLPADMALRVMSPELLRDKKKFYAWLQANPQYRSYTKPTLRPMATYVDGRAVI